MLRLFNIDLSSPRHASKLGYLLLAPAVLLILVILIYPIILSIDLSFQDVKIELNDKSRELIREWDPTKSRKGLDYVVSAYIEAMKPF